MTHSSNTTRPSSKSYETLRNEVQTMFRKVSKDPVNQALFKAVMEFYLEKATSKVQNP